MDGTDLLPLAEPCGREITVYADNNAAIEILPPGINAKTTYIEIQRISGVWYRVPVLYVIRPVASFNTRRWDSLFQAAKVAGRMTVMVH